MKKVITIDGPAGSGKSTLAENLCKQLPDFVLVDMGAYFRWATYLCLRAGLDITKRRMVYNFAKDKMNLEFGENKVKGGMTVKYKGRIINNKIFNNPKISSQVSEVAQHYLLRNLIKKNLRKFAEHENIIIAGRDTGSYTFPDAWLKIYLTASFDERVNRRHQDFSKKKKTSLKETKQIMQLRERRDTQEKDSPLKKPRGAMVIDNTKLKAKETLNLVLKEINVRKNAINKELANQLSAMAKKDQEMRRSDKWDNKVDRENTKILKKIIKEHGWPDISLVGKKGAVNAWLIAQHADHDVEFQKKCLDLMKEKLAKHLVLAKNVAYLEDRALVNSGKKQIYGTQFFQNDKGELIPRSIKNREKLNKLRQSVGMEKFEDYMDQMKKRN